MTRRGNASLLLLLVVLFGLACSDDGAGPSQSEEARSLSLEVPEFVGDGEPFQLRVRVHGSNASTPLAGFSGTAELAVSSGTISPQTVQLSGGTGQVEAAVSGATGEVSVRALLGALESTALLQVAAPGKLLPGAANDPAAPAIPDLPFRARRGDYSDTHPELGNLSVSFNTLALIFEPGTTVGEANAVLGPLDAEIVGGISGTAGQTSGILFLRLPTTTHEEMEQALAALRHAPAVRNAVQDALLSPAVVSRSNGGTPPAWKWDRTADDRGNWGHELSRVPFLWNFNPAIDKALANNKATRPITAVIDLGFAKQHADLEYEGNQIPDAEHEHGVHVAGIIGATFDNGKGVDGINPYRRLLVRADTTPTWATQITELNALLRARADTRVVNISMGYGWGDKGVDANNSVWAQTMANQTGALVHEMLAELQADGVSLPVITVSAGNDSDSGMGVQVALYSSPFTNAAIEHQAKNIIVVEAIRRDHGNAGGGTRADFSNAGGHVSAPGHNILSTVLGSQYDEMNGTSMAAPHVAGIVGYLYTLDRAIPAPTLDSNFVLDLLLGSSVNVFGARNRVDAFAAALRIDEVQGDRTILRMLVDIDDGTADGNLRVDPDDESGADYTETDADDDGGIGDGDIDMSDFRRWRDGYLALAFDGIEGAIELDGSATHPKRDLNGNGRTEADGDDETLYSFVDLNADTLFDNSAADVPSLGSVTDLEMLEEVFDDPHYASGDLGSLLFSVDIAIRPGELLDAGEAVDIHSSVRPADTEEAEDDPKFRRIHTEDEFAGEGLWQVYTVAAYEDDGTTERTYTARVIGLNAAGDTIADLERDFTGKPGQDHFWDPGCEVHENQLFLRTQSEVNAAAGICEVTGALVVADTTGTTDPVMSLLPLAQLERAAELSVSNTSQLVDLTGLGRLVLSAQGRGLDIRSNQALTSLNGLATGEAGSVQSIGLVQIIANRVLSDIAGAANLISSGIVGVVRISANPLLATLDGLEAIRNVRGAVAIFDNPSLTSLAALSQLEEVGGRITIERNGLAAIDLSALKMIQGDMDIMYNHQLTSVTLAIDSIGKKIFNGIRVADNSALTSLSIDVRKGVPELRADALPALTRLDVRVGSGRAEMVGITNTGLETIARYDVTEVVGENGFWVTRNPKLTDIEALRNLESVATYFRLVENPALCVPEWVSGINVGVSRIVRDNKDPAACEGE